MLHFNRSSTGYKLYIKEYTLPNQAYAVGINRFNIDLVTGKIPDIIVTSDFPVQQLTSLGVLDDLRPYLQEDAELDESEFLPNLIKAAEVDGKLYYLPVNFSIRVLAGEKSVVGDSGSWSVDSLIAYADKSDYDSILGENCGQEEFLSLVLKYNLNTYIDYSNNSCNFEIPEFYRLLEFAKTGFPKEGNSQLLFYYKSEQYAPIMAGEQMLYCATIGDGTDITFIDELFGGNASFVGFPTEVGGENIFEPYISFGITHASKHQETAWSFIREFYKEQAYITEYSALFPSNINALEARLSELSKKRLEPDENGSLIEKPKFYYSFSDRDGTSIKIELYALTAEELSLVRSILQNVDRIGFNDTDIEQIVIDQAKAFFAGASTAEETAKTITSRVNLLLAEKS